MRHFVYAIDGELHTGTVADYAEALRWQHHGKVDQVSETVVALSHHGGLVERTPAIGMTDRDVNGHALLTVILDDDKVRIAVAVDS